MKTIIIPTRFGYPTLDLYINGRKSTFKSGEEISVEDSVADVIENAIALTPKYDSEANSGKIYNHAIRFHAYKNDGTYICFVDYDIHSSKNKPFTSLEDAFVNSPTMLMATKDEKDIVVIKNFVSDGARYYHLFADPISQSVSYRDLSPKRAGAFTDTVTEL
jgi:hypothetical protein